MEARLKDSRGALVQEGSVLLFMRFDRGHPLFALAELLDFCNMIGSHSALDLEIGQAQIGESTKCLHSFYTWGSGLSPKGCEASLAAATPGAYCETNFNGKALVPSVNQIPFLYHPAITRPEAIAYFLRSLALRGFRCPDEWVTATCGNGTDVCGPKQLGGSSQNCTFSPVFLHKVTAEDGGIQLKPVDGVALCIP